MAADQGHTVAQNNFGCFLRMGKGGVKVNKERATYYFELATDQGHPVGCANLSGIVAASSPPSLLRCAKRRGARGGQRGGVRVVEVYERKL
jgi:TPR repeat protein